MNKMVSYWKEGWKPLGRYVLVSSLIGASFVPVKFIAITLFVFIESKFVVFIALGIIYLLFLPVVTKWASDSTNQLKTKVVYPHGFLGPSKEE